MADTISTRAALVALLADNTTGAISPQDLRDMLISIDAANGCLSVSASAATALTGAAYPTNALLLAGTTALGLANNVSMPSNMRLRNDSGVSQRFSVRADVSMTSSVNNVVITFAIYKNGVLESGSEQSRKIGTGTDVGSLGLSWVVDLADTEYVEIYVQSDTTTNLTAQYANLMVSSELI
jgi:hypothetical protein